MAGGGPPPAVSSHFATSPRSSDAGHYAPPTFACGGCRVAQIHRCAAGRDVHRRGRLLELVEAARARHVDDRGRRPPTTTVAARRPVHAAGVHARTPSAPVTATPVAGSTSDYDITSFDGTKIRVHWFPLARRPAANAPTVLKGPGWGRAGRHEHDVSNFGLFGDLSISAARGRLQRAHLGPARLRASRAGTIETDSPDFEGRDVEQLIDWVAQQPGVQLDAPGDPRMGMVGASYGGGIQLVTAGDRLPGRRDRAADRMALAGHQPLQGRTPRRPAGATCSTPRPRAARSTRTSRARTTTSDATGIDQRGRRSNGSSTAVPGDLVNKITAPTLFEQGTIDTLFTLDEAVTNYDILKANGVPTAMLWMCSGHGVCLTNPGDQSCPDSDAIAWLDRYVKDNTKAKPRRAVRVRRPERHRVHRRPSTRRPRRPRSPRPARAPSPSSPAAARARRTATGNAGVLGGISLPITPAKATHAVNVPITVTERRRTSWAHRS